MRLFRALISLIVFISVIFVIKTLFFSSPLSSPFTDTNTKQHLAIIIDNLPLMVPETNSLTVQELLDQLHISTNSQDFLWPNLDTPLASNLTITLNHHKTIRLKTAAGNQTLETQNVSTESFLAEQHINLNDNDIVLPDDDAPLTNNLTLRIIRVQIDTKIINQPIPYTTTENDDPKLSWRKKIVTQKGVHGNKALAYQILSHDGKEISRKLIHTEVTQQPKQEIITQGTYVQVGKAHTGLGSWYTFTGTLSAANPWLPIGSYVRVTNQDNGKQVIVRINDRGPFGKNRIIDLDKVAFQQIASLGTGVINVKMEEIVN
jgi:rare lipoprotein A